VVRLVPFHTITPRSWLHSHTEPDPSMAMANTRPQLMGAGMGTFTKRSPSRRHRPWDVDAHIDDINVLTLDDPELFKYPLAYMAEPGRWLMSDKEAANFRDYLLKGGFVIFDDFRGGYDWNNFEQQIRRVLPEGQFVDLDASKTIFHSFFEIDTLDIVPQYYDRGAPAFRAIFEGNDPNKRMMVMVNYNTDISEYWEEAGTGWRPDWETNEAYKFGVNYVIYGMTH